MFTEICQDEMGLENGAMADQQFSASSVLNNDVHKYGPFRARLNGMGSWVPVPTTLGTTQWIQVLCGYILLLLTNQNSN